MHKNDSHPQMSGLVQQHAEGIAFADELIRIAEQGRHDDLARAVNRVKEYNESELEPHLQHEEQTILRTLIQNYPEHRELCIRIGQEHGHLRTLVEKMGVENAQALLAEFGKLLKEHTLLEDQELFPLVDQLFSQQQLDEIAGFAPLQRLEPKIPGKTINRKSGHNESEWFPVIKDHVNQAGKHAGIVMLLPRFDPELNQQIASQLAFEFFDFQSEVMDALGADAEHLELDELTSILNKRAQSSGIVSHNVEALLCVKSETERQEWLNAFMDQDWPNPVVLPITVFQADVLETHPMVCDLEV